MKRNGKNGIDVLLVELSRKEREIRRNIRQLQYRRMLLCGLFAALTVGMAALRWRTAFTRESTVIASPVLRLNRHASSSLSTTIPLFRTVPTQEALQVAG